MRLPNPFRAQAIGVLDMSLVRMLNRTMTLKGVQPFFSMVSWLGNGKFWYALMLVLPLCSPVGWRASLHMGIVALVNLQLYRFIKKRAQRPRPCNACEDILRGTAPLDEFSFPSGHTMHAIGFTVIALAWFPQLALILTVFTVLTILSRMILGLHYPTDVLLGAGLGFAVAKVSLMVLGMS